MNAAPLADAVCLHCGAAFTTENPWRDMFCTEDCRRRRVADRDRRRDQIRDRDFARVLERRDQNARWCAEHRGCTRPRPWLAGPPPFATHMPGLSMALSFDPHPTWPVELRNTRGLHGAITAILDAGHGPRFSNFALFPAGSGWACHHWTDAGANLAGRSVNATLYDRPTRVTFGIGWRLRAPTVARRGHRRLVVETITPVVIRTHGGAKECARPSSPALQGALAGEWLNRFGLGYLKERDLLRVECVEVETEPAHVMLGGKYGLVKGWQGRVVVECNAPAHWLFEAGARVGFGSRTAFGFGRIRVTEVSQ